MKGWDTREAAERLRQWPTLAWVVERVSYTSAFDALFLVGSFAKGSADEASDLDLVVLVGEGRFGEAWEGRLELQPPDTLVGWDFRPDPERELGVRKFLTRDLVMTELSMSTPSSGARLADPFVVLVGDAQAAARFVRVGSIPPEVLDEYARKLVADGLVPEVEKRYNDLMGALRAAWRAGRVD